MTELYMPVDKVKFDINRILTDFNRTFWYFTCANGSPIVSIDDQMNDAIDKLNNGQCFIVASHVGYIAKQLHPDADIRIANGPSHEWIHYDGTDFDTLFPSGYPCQVADMWNTDGDEDWSSIRTVPVGEERNKGRWDWVLIYTFKALCQIYGVKYPSYMGAFEEGARQTDIPGLRPQQEPEMKTLYDRFQAGYPIWDPCMVGTKRFRYPKCHPEWTAPGFQPAKVETVYEPKRVFVTTGIPVATRYDKTEMDRVRKLWEDKLAGPTPETTPALEPAQEDDTLLLLLNEWRYRELIRDMRNGNPYRNVESLQKTGVATGDFVKVLKDITNQSFDGKNFFASGYVDHTAHASVPRYHAALLPNQVSREQFRKMDWKMMYQEHLDAITIPLTRPKGLLHWKARLVIGIPRIGKPQIAIQTLMIQPMEVWVTFPCTTSTVKDVCEFLLYKDK